jgi:hypothetical protein
MMDYQLTIIQKDEKSSYLHIVGTGRNTREAVAGFLMRGFQECLDRDYPRVLIESRLVGPNLPLWDIFELASQVSSLDMGFFEAIAYVDADDPPELAQFIENVTRNRSLPLRAFPTVTAAERWLATRFKERSLVARVAA